MGSSFSNLSKEDLEFLKIYTSSDEKAIKEQYKEFKKQTAYFQKDNDDDNPPPIARWCQIMFSEIQKAGFCRSVLT